MSCFVYKPCITIMQLQHKVTHRLYMYRFIYNGMYTVQGYGLNYSLFTYHSALCVSLNTITRNTAAHNFMVLYMHSYMC